MLKTDVLIIGGGPAGAACALRLRQLSIQFVVLDKAAFPRQKPCAGWITPEIFDLLDRKPGDYPGYLTKFYSFNISFRGLKFTLPTHQYAIRRMEFDAWLLSLAEVTPIQHTVQKIETVDGGYQIDDCYQANYLVGAGGTHCPVRRALFPHDQASKNQRLIITKEEEFPYDIADYRCHLWFFEDGLPGYSWYFPKAGGYLNVGIGASASGLRNKGSTLNEFWHRHLEKLEDLKLVQGHKFKPIGYSYYLRSKSPQIRKGNAFLVGDALGLATCDMGEGIRPAIQSGIMAAEMINSGLDEKIKNIPRFSFPSLIKI